MTRTFLVSWNNRLLRDDITRRLLALRLLQDLGPEVFAGHCQRARNICAEYLQTPSTQMPEVWAVELLYQFLQQHGGKIQDQQKRSEIQQEFFSKILPDTLHRLVDKRNKREEHAALIQMLESDWEFQNTLNYFLRADKYNDEPYQKLKQKIDEILSLKQEPGKNNG